MNAVERYYKQAPPLAKNAMIILGVAVVGVTAFELYKLIRQNAKDRDANQAGQAAQNDIYNLERQGQRRSLSDSQIDSLITALATAMTDCGTDEDAVYNAFRKLNNNLDFLYLVRNFGVQYYQPCSITSPISYAKYLLNPKEFPGDLPTWLNYDLSQSEIDKVNAVLRGRGISYQF